MAVFFNNTQGATKISAPPRIIIAYDDVGGCPPTRTSPLITITATVNNPAYFRFMSGIIRNANARTDLQCFVQGPAGSNYASNTLLTRRLNWTATGTWDDTNLDATAYGNIAGTYTFTLTADSPSSWGCGRYHGGAHLLVLET